MFLLTLVPGHSIKVTDTEVGVSPDDQLQYSASDEGSPIPFSKGEFEPSLPPPSTPSASLLERIRVNSIGDYYRIDELVTLANAKITHLLRSNKKDQSWVPSLPLAIEAAVRSTGDGELLDILASATAANISTVTELDQFESIRVMTGFSMKVLRSCAQEIQTLEKAVEESRRTIELQQAQEQQSKCEISRLCRALRIQMRVFSVATSAGARISIEHSIRHMHAPGYERDSKASPPTFVEFHDGLWPANWAYTRSMR